MPPYYHRIIRALKAISVPFSFVPLNTGMSMQFWSSFKKMYNDILKLKQLKRMFINFNKIKPKFFCLSLPPSYCPKQQQL